MSFWDVLGRSVNSLLGNWTAVLGQDLANWYTQTGGTVEGTIQAANAQVMDYIADQFDHYMNPLGAVINDGIEGLYDFTASTVGSAMNAIMPGMGDMLVNGVVNPLFGFINAKFGASDDYLFAALQAARGDLSGGQNTIIALMNNQVPTIQAYMNQQFQQQNSLLGGMFSPFFSGFLGIGNMNADMIIRQITTQPIKEGEDLWSGIGYNIEAWTPLIAYNWTEQMKNTGNIVAGGLAAGLIAAELLTLGQLDYTLTEISKIPIIEGTISAASKIQGRMLEVGLIPLVDRLWKYLFRPELPGPAEAAQMFFRGAITQLLYDEALDQAGYGPNYARGYKEILKPMPSVRDFIEFAVKEAYENENVYTPPGQFINEIAKLGFTEHWGRLWWAAHWQLPAVGQVFEMFHRKVDMPYTIQDYLRIADIAPEWRQPLVDISYSLLPRVDLRKVFKVGRISEAELAYRYELLGFNPQDSQFEAEAQIDYILTSSRTAKKSAIQKFYKAGFLQKEQLKSELLKIPMSDAEATEWEQSIAWEGLLDFLNDTAAYYLTQFEKGEIANTVCVMRLKSLGMDEKIAQLKINVIISKKQKGGALRIVS